MAAALLLSSQIGATALAAGVTNYTAIGDIAYTGGNTTESTAQQTIRPAATFDKLWARVTANTLNATTTIRTRKGGANGNQVITFSSTTTGTQEDSTNTDTVTSGDVWNYSMVTAAGSGTVTLVAIALHMTGTTDTIVHIGSFSNSNAFTTASVTRFVSMGGFLGNGSTETVCELKFKTAGTLKNLFVRCSSNARTSATTFATRKNGADGNMTVSFGSTVSGTQEDTTHTDTVSVDERWNFRWTTGTGTQTINIVLVTCDFVTTDGTTMWGATSFVGGTGTAQNISLTKYYMLQGVHTAATSAESEAQVKVQQAVTASLLEIRVQANTVTATSTFTLRKNAANGNQSVSIGSGVTGWLEDSTHTDSLSATDLVNAALVTGGTGTSLSFASTGMKISTVSAVTLTVQEATSAQAADSVVLVQQNVLAVQEATQAQAADSVALIQQNRLTVADATSAQAADAVALIQQNRLTVAEATHAQTADSVALIQQNRLAMQEATHAQSADAVALIQQNILALQDALQAMASDSLVLVQANILAVAEALHALSSESPALLQAYVLAVEDALHAQAADRADLLSGDALNVAETIHAMTADAVVLAQAHLLTVEEAAHAQAAESPTLLATYALIVASAHHNQAADSITITQASVLAIRDALHAHTADVAQLTTLLMLEVRDAHHAQYGGGIIFGWVPIQYLTRPAWFTFRIERSADVVLGIHRDMEVMTESGKEMAF